MASCSRIFKSCFCGTLGGMGTSGISRTDSSDRICFRSLPATGASVGSGRRMNRHLTCYLRGVIGGRGRMPTLIANVVFHNRVNSRANRPINAVCGYGGGFCASVSTMGTSGNTSTSCSACRGKRYCCCSSRVYRGGKSRCVSGTVVEGGVCMLGIAKFRGVNNTAVAVSPDNRRDSGGFCLRLGTGVVP